MGSFIVLFSCLVFRGGRVGFWLTKKGILFVNGWSTMCLFDCL